jgi:uncharacterized protein YndB with AHSA1/START domain
MPANHELTLTRLIDAPRAKLFRCFREPELLKFAHKPYTVPIAELDFRVGGASRIVMRSPEGQDIPCPGTYLEIIPDRKLVFTDAYLGEWEPSGKPFMTAIITFDDENGQTRYTARARHYDRGRQEDARTDGLPPGLGHLRRSTCGARQVTPVTALP